jgi:hypothetical protein
MTVGEGLANLRVDQKLFRTEVRKRTKERSSLFLLQGARNP